LNDNQPAEKETEKGNESKISRREFLKYGAGVAAVAVGATALMGRIPLPGDSSNKTPAANDSSEAIVATVEGNQVTVMNGQKIVKTNDSGLAAQIADKVS
jgi:TAT (twin-arginine translocation) pathway signal sequence